MRKKATIFSISVALWAALFVCLAEAPDAHATDTVTIKMVLNNTQAKTVREAKGKVVSIRLTAPQVELIRVRAPKFKGATIRLSSDKLTPANKLWLMILKPSSGTPVLRVVKPHTTR